MRSLLAFLLLVPLTACGNDPAMVAGQYSVAVTNRDNGCNLANWTVGAMSSNIPVDITQNGVMASATVTGIVGVAVSAALGSNVFTGDVDGNDLNLTLYGTVSHTAGNCTYTYNAVINATLSGDILQGTIDYKAKTNGNPDCTSMNITNCNSRQDFNGTRPPT